MSKTAILAISYGAYSRNDYSGWTDGSNDLYAARDDNGVYWFTKLKFSTAGLRIKKSTSLTVTHTLCGTSNPYGTTAILTTSELTPSQIHALTSESAVTAVSGYVAHTHCTSHTSSENQDSGTVISYTFETEGIAKDTTYYVYIKRRVGLANSESSSPNGWTEFYNPCYSGSYAAYSTLTLAYEASGYVNIDNGTELLKGTAYIDDGNGLHRYAAYIDNGSAFVRYSG